MNEIVIAAKTLRVFTDTAEEVGYLTAEQVKDLLTAMSVDEAAALYAQEAAKVVLRGVE